MNEIQIIQHQLATERQHFSRVGEIFAAALQARPAPDAALMRVCLDYFEFALTRLAASASEARTRLQAARAAEAAAAPHRWQDFLQAFTRACAERFDSIDALGARQQSVVHWRSVARLNADSIVGERECFARVQACISAPS